MLDMFEYIHIYYISTLNECRYKMSDLPGTFVQLLSEVFDAFWLCKKFIINEN